MNKFLFLCLMASVVATIPVVSQAISIVRASTAAELEVEKICRVEEGSVLATVESALRFNRIEITSFVEAPFDPRFSVQVFGYPVGATGSCVLSWSIEVYFYATPLAPLPNVGKIVTKAQMCRSSGLLGSAYNVLQARLNDELRGAVDSCVSKIGKIEILK